MTTDPHRITGVHSGWSVVLKESDARRLARDRAALTARTAGEARHAGPGPDVLALIAGLPDEAEIDLGRLPVVTTGTLPVHPLCVMRDDPLLAGLGREEDTAFLGQARLIPAGDLSTLEAWFGWRRDQRAIDAALGIRNDAMRTFTSDRFSR